MTYTDGRYIVADTLQELHKLAKSIGLKRSEHFHFSGQGRRCYYLTEYASTTHKAIQKGAKKVNTRQVVDYALKLPATDVHSGHIQKALFKYFENYTYKLTNSIVTNWEADFFCRSDSGYFVETEIKISRSDYLRDFEKPKHKYFAALKSGKNIIVEKTKFGEQYPGDLIAKYVVPKIMMQYGPFGHYKKYGWGNGLEVWPREYHNGKIGFWVNDWGEVLRVVQEPKDLHAGTSNVSYTELDKIHLPHQFYFCVPDGLIKKEELPDYAGLLYVKNEKVTQIKRAPYLHKRKMDLTRTLLSKFYNLWAFKQSVEDRIEMTEMYNEQNNTTA